MTADPEPRTEGATTIPRLLAQRRAECGDRQGLVDDDGAITFAELDDTSRTLAAHLVATGIDKGDRVGLLMPNGIGWATAALATMRVGAVLVPLSTLLRPPELAAQLHTAAVAFLICVPTFRDRDYLADLESIAPGFHLHPSALPSVTPSALVAGLRGAARRPATTTSVVADEVADVVQALEDRVQPADDMAVLFTSGSRGAPKGTIHTHGSALRAVAAGLDARRVRAGERLYIPMPFFWTGGFAGGLLTALVAGATLLTEAIPEPDRTLAMLARERVTLFRGWPDQAARLAAHPAFADTDLSGLGPGSLPAVLPVDQRPAPGARPNLFGMTESFGPWCGDRLDVDMPAGKWGSCGRPFPGIEVRVVDPDTGDAVTPGEPGEIWLRGPTLLRSLCGRDRSTVFTADGFYRTGDRGRLDADGYLWYDGRLDDMVKVKGATVYPSEVEAALRSLPQVSHAYVADIPDDGAVQVGALVVSDADLDEIAAAARDRLSAFKVPTVWLVVDGPDAVPTSATGKVDKPALQELLQVKGTASGTSRSRTGQEGSAR